MRLMNMEEEKTKIAHLNLTTNKKSILAYLIEAKKIAQVAAHFDLTYNYVSQIFAVWVYKSWIRKLYTDSGKVIYKLNTEVLEV